MLKKNVIALIQNENIDIDLFIQELLNRSEEGFLKKLYDVESIKYSLQIIMAILDRIDFDGYSTADIYKIYSEFCIENEAPEVLSKIEFSRFMCKWFDYKIINLKKNGKKYRVFRKVQDEMPVAVRG